MTDKPQTLAEQIRVEEIECVSIESGFEEPADPIWRIALNGYCADFEYREAAENFAEQIRAALADAAEQAGDVRQSWRVKPLVWHNFDAWTWWAESTSGTYRVEERNGVWRATLNLPMTEHVIYEYTTDGTTPNDFEAAHLACQADHTARITAALEPDPTPALGWRAMQTAAANEAQSWVRRAMHLNPDGYEIERVHGNMAVKAHEAILALPSPSDAQALAEAVKLPEWQVMATDMREVRLAVNALEGKDKLDRELITAISARLDAALAQICGAA